MDPAVNDRMKNDPAGIHSLAKIQSIDGDYWDCGHWFAGVDLLYSRTAIEGRHGDGL
jgi:hypothetical protein